MNNPSRSPTVPPSWFGNKPLLSDAELRRQTMENMEAGVVRAICREFRIPFGPVIEASYAYSALRKPSVLGLNDAADTPFPCDIQLLRPKKGHGQVCTLAKLLKNPLGNKLLLEFVASVDESERPVLMIGMHPRITEHLAVTNLEMKPDDRCCQMMFEVGEAKAKVDEPPDDEALFRIVVIATLPGLLRAIRRQELWVP